MNHEHSVHCPNRVCAHNNFGPNDAGDSDDSPFAKLRTRNTVTNDTKKIEATQNFKFKTGLLVKVNSASIVFYKKDSLLKRE